MLEDNVATGNQNFQGNNAHPTSANILLIEDSEADYVRIRTYLKSLTNSHLKLDWISDYGEALSEMAANRHDIYLLDYFLGGRDGLDLLQEALRKGCQGPVIFLTGFGDLQLDLRAMESGAVDFLVKDKIDETVLERSIRYCLQNWRIRRQLETSLREKEILFREVHHRVKNNLQIVTSLLRLQSRQVTQDAARKALQESCDRIRAMSLIHDQLYRSQNVEAVSFSDYVRFLVEELSRVYGIDSGRIALKQNIEHTHVALDKAVPCGLIVYELVTNAFKHAFPDGKKGTLGINFKRIDNETLELCVWDDGIGIPNRLASLEDKSLGWDLIQAFAAQLQSTPSLSSENGTKWTFRFKEKL